MLNYGVWFEITDGNFALPRGPFGNSTAEFDLGSVPVGKQMPLTYTAKDEFGNEANHSVAQNIDVRDAGLRNRLFSRWWGNYLAASFGDSSDLAGSNSSAVLEFHYTWRSIELQ